jgi:hypothetical protein
VRHSNLKYAKLRRIEQPQLPIERVLDVGRKFKVLERFADFEAPAALGWLQQRL